MPRLRDCAPSKITADAMGFTAAAPELGPGRDSAPRLTKVAEEPEREYFP